MIDRKKTMSRFKELFPQAEGSSMLWHYFKRFYELGWEDCQESISNPFPSDDPENKKWIEELDEMSRIENKPENIQDFN